MARLALLAVLALCAAPALGSSIYYQGANCPTDVCYQRCETFATVDFGAPTAFLLNDTEFYRSLLLESCQRGCDNYGQEAVGCELLCTQQSSTNEVLGTARLLSGDLTGFGGGVRDIADVFIDSPMSVVGLLNELLEGTDVEPSNFVTQNVTLPQAAALVNNVAKFVVQRLNILTKLKTYCYAGCSHQTIECSGCSRNQAGCDCVAENCRNCVEGLCVKCDDGFQLVSGGVCVQDN